MFDEIFTLVSKLFELQNESLYFRNVIPKNIAPVILNRNANYDLDNKAYFDTVCDINFYVIKGDCTFNAICIDTNKPAIIVSVHKQFLENDIKSVIEVLNNIYAFILDIIIHKNLLQLDPVEMSRIFTLFTMNKYMSGLKISDFNIENYSEDVVSQIIEYTIKELYDLNMIYIFNINKKE